MKTGYVLRLSLRVGVLALLAGVFFKIAHYPGADWLLGAALLASLAFIMTALVEIAGSRQATGGEKVLWMTVILLGGLLGGILYLLVGRDRIVAELE